MKYMTAALLVTISAGLPFYVSADVVDDVGQTISDTASDLGETAEDVGSSISDATSNAGTAVSDSLITAQVKAKFALEDDIPVSISVTTKDKIVYLDGQVETGLQAEKAIEIAKSINGVASVNSAKLTVQSSESYFDDSFITLHTKMKIASLAGDKKISSNYDLQVETTNGQVHIFGTVSDKADVDAIKKAVAEIDGVQGVHTNIKVNSKS